MHTSNDWPEPLRAFFDPHSGGLLFKPRGLIPGQLLAFVVAGVMLIMAATAIVSMPSQRLLGCGVLLGALALFWMPLSRAFEWTLIERAANGLQLSHGLYRWRRATKVVGEGARATAMVVKDERGYRFEVPRYEHVRVAFPAAPFGEAPRPLEVAELYKLPRPVLEALRDLLGGENAVRDNIA